MSIRDKSVAVMQEVSKYGSTSDAIFEVRQQLSAAQARIAELEQESGEPVGVVTVNVHGTPSVQGLAGLPHGSKLYLRAPQAVPEGWKLVPIEPTEAMIEAGDAQYAKLGIIDPTVHTWEAMLSAAPSPEGDKNANKAN